MGGVMVRDYQIWPQLLPFLGLTGKSFADCERNLIETVQSHSRGEITENDFWAIYPGITCRQIPAHDESETLFAKFFNPKMDEPTLQTVQELKSGGMRTVCGTNVIEAHYKIHTALKQYAVFDKVYASHLIGLAKPDPAFYKYILIAEGIEPNDTFFTDDSAANVESALSLGMNAYLYTDAEALSRQLQFLGLIKKKLPRIKLIKTRKLFIKVPNKDKEYNRDAEKLLS